MSHFTRRLDKKTVLYFTEFDHFGELYNKYKLEEIANNQKSVRNQAEHYSTVKNIANLSEEVDKTKSTIVNDDIIMTQHDKCQMT